MTDPLKIQQIQNLLQDSLVKAKEILNENDKLIQKLASQQEKLLRLNDLSLASASLIGSINSPSKEAEKSSLITLAKLDKSSALKEENEKEDEASPGLIGGKYLNQIMAIIADATLYSSEPANLISQVQLEKKLESVFDFGEKKGIIPKVESQKSWKAQTFRHEPLYKNISSLTKSEEEEEKDKEEKE